MTTNGTISSVGNITTNGSLLGLSLSITRSSPVSASTPTVAGVHLNNYSGNAHIDLAGSSSGGGCIDFTIVGTVRMAYSRQLHGKDDSAVMGLISWGNACIS